MGLADESLVRFVFFRDLMEDDFAVIRPRVFDVVSRVEKLKEAIRSAYKGKKVFIWLPTGYGKSLCFNLPPFSLWLQVRKGELTSPKTQCLPC